MFTNRIIYREKSRSKPEVKDFNIKREELLNIATEIRRIMDMMTEPSDENNEVGFFMDNVAVSTAELFKGLILGSGLKVSVKDDEKATEIIRNWNESINVNGQDIEDFMGDFITDNLIYNRSYWRIARKIRGIDNEIREDIDIQRMDPKTIEMIVDNHTGVRKFVQETQPSPKYKSVSEFLKAEFDIYSIGPDYPRWTSIVIPDDQRLIINGKLFTKAPMDTALPYIILKYWLLTFMKKYADKSWAGILIGYVGDPKTSYYPDDPITMQDAINKTTNSLVKLRNFGAATFPGDTRIEQIEPPQQGRIYSDWFDKMNREIAYCFYSSIGLRDSNSTFKGNEQINENLVNFAKTIRRKLENITKRFYIMNLVPWVKKRDIIFGWSELRTTSVQAYADAFSKAVTAGVFKHARERRRALAPIWEFLEDDITDGEASELDSQLNRFNAPSQPGDNNSQASAKNNNQSRRTGGKS